MTIALYIQWNVWTTPMSLSTFVTLCSAVGSLQVVMPWLWPDTVSGPVTNKVCKAVSASSSTYAWIAGVHLLSLVIPSLPFDSSCLHVVALGMAPLLHRVCLYITAEAAARRHSNDRDTTIRQDLTSGSCPPSRSPLNSHSTSKCLLLYRKAVFQAWPFSNQCPEGWLKANGSFHRYNLFKGQIFFLLSYFFKSQFSFARPFAENMNLCHSVIIWWQVFSFFFSATSFLICEAGLLPVGLFSVPAEL